MQTIVLTEYEKRLFPPETLTLNEAELLWQRYRQQILVEPPSFKTQGQWQLTAQGWCGFVPLNRDLAFAIEPKVPLSSLFEMLSLAYGLDEVEFGEELIGANVLDGLVDGLAWLLARQVEGLWRQGLAQGYVERIEPLPYISGQIEVAALAASAKPQQVVCRHEILTPDVRSNQILLWTLHLILQMGRVSTKVQQAVQRSYRLLAPQITLRTVRADELPPLIANHQTRNRFRTNQNSIRYEQALALCHFFLNHCGPSHQVGDQSMVSFLIPTAHLFERFVAIWLQQNLPSQYTLRIQERQNLGSHEHLHFAIDLAVYERSSGQIRWVMDTKYKVPNRTPSTDDIAQVIAYAEATGSLDAVLIYPLPLAQKFDEQIGQIRVRALPFDLGRNLNHSGEEYLKVLGYATIGPDTPHRQAPMPP
ncbi:MAG: hypothetical protein AAF702_43410 [Chloroflexota bacterium]